MGIKQSRYHRYNRSSNHQRQPRDNSPRRESVNTNTTSGVSQSNNSVTIDGRQYYQDETSTYILPRDEIEQDRLNSVTIRNYTYSYNSLSISNTLL